MQTLPYDFVSDWDGDIETLPAVAERVVRVVGVPTLRELLPTIPTIIALPEEHAVGPACSTTESLLSSLQLAGPRAIIPVSADLVAGLRRPRARAGQVEYYLKTILDWALEYRGQPLANVPIKVVGQGTNIYRASDQSLFQILNDSRSGNLITLIGAPGAGKTFQLRLANALDAFEAVRNLHTGRQVGSFYVSLSDHPQNQETAFARLENAWSALIDDDSWCDLPSFLRQGGSLLLDGYSEVGGHDVELSEWMREWRTAVAECFRRGGRRVVVSCRTQDQLVPLGNVYNDEPTGIVLGSIDRRELIDASTRYHLRAGVIVDAALVGDAELAQFYASPFRFRVMLDSGAAVTARTDSRLFGLAIAGAVIRQRNRFGVDQRLLPEREVATLVAAYWGEGSDMWRLLADLPLIRLLGYLARELTSSGAVRGNPAARIEHSKARDVLAAGLQTEGLGSVSAREVLRVATDLHILFEDSRQDYSFSHTTVRQILSVMYREPGGIVRGISESAVQPSSSEDWANYHHSGSELFGTALSAAQMHGEQFTQLLADVDPVMAAHAHAAGRYSGTSDVGFAIRTKLLETLGAIDDATGAIGVLESLAVLGWHPHDMSIESPTYFHEVPGQPWDLGRAIGPVSAELDKGREELMSRPRTVYVDGFKIADCPVTVGEYQLFVLAGGYEDKRFWTTDGWDWRTRRDAMEKFVSNWSRKRNELSCNRGRIIELVRDRSASIPQAAALLRFAEMKDSELMDYAIRNLQQPIRSPRSWSPLDARFLLNPVVGVSWYEANAFCRWRSVTSGLAIRLPSEDEWEAACVWRLGRAPLAGPINSLEFELRRTSPVGAFNVGSSESSEVPKDLMGNCFEWTFDYYGVGDNLRKAVKGGSWRQEAWRAHPAYRGRGDASIRNDDIGFRVVVDITRPGDDQPPTESWIQSS